MPFKQVPCLFRLFAFTAVFLAIGSFSCKAQYFDTLEVVPENPTIHDTLKLNRKFTIYSIGTKVSDTLYRASDTIYLISCFRKGLQPSSKTFRDTFEIGALPSGIYYVKAISYYSFSTSGCIPIDTANKLLIFSVIDDIGLPEINNGNKINVELYPNPSSSHQQITLYTQIPIPVQINLHSVSGKKVMEVYNGQSVQGQQEFEVDLSQLASGVYFYHVKLGEETRHLKAIKH